ncbi:outer membrane protein assembly factor BamE [Sphingomonas profundi]|uniref:outer membrane protein assembly factor BamE n=1 Tax=Alterirhizorhabdus profundi TaxID=2681549 RepID=UPI0012E81656|nr:outer membrane protein assembly factor BamE [Sphingomonas profundi]
MPASRSGRSARRSSSARPSSARPSPARIATIVLAGGALAITAGCARIRDHKGYVVDSTLIDTVQPGIDNRDSVAKTLGRPSFAGEFDGDRSWYYVSRDTRQFAFSRPKPVAQTILAVKFDAAGNVVSVQKGGMEKVVSISPDGDKTPTLGRNRGFFRELFGNIGRVGGAGGPSQSGGTTDNPN